MRTKDQIFNKPKKEKKKKKIMPEKKVDFESYGEEEFPKERKSFLKWLFPSPKVKIFTYYLIRISAYIYLLIRTKK